jgi:hypothetical protein
MPMAASQQLVYTPVWYVRHVLRFGYSVADRACLIE